MPETLTAPETLSLSQSPRQETPVARGAAGQWVQVLPHLDPVYGGLSAVVPKLASQLRTQVGMGVRVAAFCSPDESGFATQQQDPDLSIWPLSRLQWMRDSSLRMQFGRVIGAADAIHIHGLWESSTLVAASAARKAGVPYVLSAHGMLERWALQNKRLKKAAYAALFEHRNVNAAACAHALTHAEADDYRRFGYTGPVAVIPNGVEADPSADATTFLDRFPSAQGKQLLLFLGRIHYKKGINLLLEAWAQLAAAYPDALLVIAGPDSEDSLRGVMESVTSLGLSERVLFTGMLDKTMKWSALAAASCFVLPSYSEGLSVAALEALSMGVPLIVSDQCNLPQVQQSGAGWQVQTNVESLAAAIDAALSSSPERRQVLRFEAQQLALREFSWPSVTERMAELYRWVTGGPAPVQTALLRTS